MDVPDFAGSPLENSLTRYGAASILGISPLRAWDFRSEQQPGGAPVEMTGDEFVDFRRSDSRDPPFAPSAKTKTALRPYESSFTWRRYPGSKG